ncbi:MAG: FG-GAP-like repeat-containing protein [Acidimicrobiales bacterium]
MPSPRPLPHHHHRTRRSLAKIVVLGVVATLFVLLPAPRVEAVESAVVDTRTPTLGPEALGRRTASETTGIFDMLGVGLPTGSAGDAMVRVRTDGDWGSWRHLDVSPDHRPENHEASSAARRAPGTHSEPVWFGGADAYEISVAASVASIEVHLVRPSISYVTTSSDAVAGAATSANASRPDIRSRAQWGARAPKKTPSIAPDLKLAVVHHSVNANTYSRDDVPALLRSIQAYHMDAQGWDDIAYNFAVDRFGRIWEARAGGVGNAVIGGHARGFNTYSVGVMVLGDFTSAEPSNAAVASVADVIGWKFAHHQVDVRGRTPFTSMGGTRHPDGTVLDLPRVVAHRDVGQTGCPGERLYDRLGEIRATAISRFDMYIARQPESPLFGDFNADGRRDVLRYRPGARQDVWWSHPGTGLVETPLYIGSTYRPVVADFDGDGADDVLWYGPGSYPPDRLWYGGPDGFTSTGADLPAHGLPLVAELDGDGIDDLILYSPGEAADHVYLGGADRTLTPVDVAINGTYDPAIADFDGDGRDDIYWYGYGTGTDSVWFSDGAGSFTSVPAKAASGASIPIVGDFDGSGRADLLFYGPGDAPDEMWWGETGPRGTHLVEPLTVRGATYVPIVGDVTGGGGDDLLWYQPGTGPDTLWSWLPARVRTDRSLTVNGTYVPDAGRYTTDEADDVIWMSPDTTSHLWVATGAGRFRSTTLR